MRLIISTNLAFFAALRDEVFVREFFVREFFVREFFVREFFVREFLYGVGRHMSKCISFSIAI